MLVLQDFAQTNDFFKTLASCLMNLSSVLLLISTFKVKKSVKKRKKELKKNINKK